MTPRTLLRRHAGALEAREYCRLRAAAVLRGDGPSTAAASSGASWQARAAWNEALDALEAAGRMTVYAVDVERLTGMVAAATAALANRAALAPLPGPEAAELAEGWATIAAGAAAEHAERSADAARQWAGLAAWAADALAVAPWRILEALMLEGAERDRASGRGGPTPEAVAAWWRDARETIARAIAEHAPDPEAVDAAAAEWANVAAE